MRPTILVDQDGPLSGWDQHFFALADQNAWEMDCTVDTQVHRYATDHIPDREHRRAARAAADGPGFYRALPVVDGAVDGMAELAERADVWICTRPLASSSTCRDEKAAWVAEVLGSKWLERLIMAPDKSMVRGDLLLDDAPKLDWLGRAVWRPVIYTTSFNGDGSDWAGLPHWTWADGVDALLALVDPATAVRCVEPTCRNLLPGSGGVYARAQAHGWARLVARRDRPDGFRCPRCREAGRRDG